MDEIMQKNRGKCTVKQGSNKFKYKLLNTSVAIYNANKIYF